MLKDAMAILARMFPIFSWSRSYGIEKGLSDLVAGITVGLTLIPQSMAYASLAELTPEYGLYSSMCGGFVYVFFGTVPELHIAPTALLSLLTFTHTLHVTFGKEYAVVLLCLMSGLVELLCGILHLGFLVNFVSTPVVAAFTSAGAITIATSQVKNLLGLRFTAETFIGVWLKVFEHIKETKLWDAILGSTCFIVLLGLRKLKDFAENDEVKEDREYVQTWPKLRKILWFIAVSRNAVVVITCSVVSYILLECNVEVLSLTSNVPSGLPNVTLPQFTREYNNETFTFFEMNKQLGIGLFVVPFIAILGNVAIAKAFAKGKVIDASQEMVAVGICNIVASFFGSYPINASFSRAAISNASNVKTPISGIYTALMVILSLTFLTPFFSYIPKSTLAAVVICAVMFMVEVTMTKLIWKINKIDLIPFTITLLSCLLITIEIGIIIGVLVDIIFLLYANARPKILIEHINEDLGINYIRVTPTSAITFPSAEYIREKVVKIRKEKPSIDTDLVVIDCHRVHKVDFTAGKCLGALVSDLRNNRQNVIFLQPKSKIIKVLKNVCRHELIIADNEEDLQNYIKGASEIKTVYQNQKEESTRAEVYLPDITTL